MQILGTQHSVWPNPKLCADILFRYEYDYGKYNLYKVGLTLKISTCCCYYYCFCYRFVAYHNKVGTRWKIIVSCSSMHFIKLTNKSSETERTQLISISTFIPTTFCCCCYSPTPTFFPGATPTKPICINYTVEYCRESVFRAYNQLTEPWWKRVNIYILRTGFVSGGFFFLHWRTVNYSESISIRPLFRVFLVVSRHSE